MKTGCYFTYQGEGRIAISRGIPRGLRAGYSICRALAPGSWYRSCSSIKEYRNLYMAEILGKLDAHEMWNRLHEIAGVHEPVLLCYERPPFDEVRNYCHRRMVADWFERELGYEVPEYSKPIERGLFGVGYQMK